MNDIDSLKKYPKSQIKPYDGMSITAEIWHEAHDEHRQALQAHNLLLHGAGVVTGLEVIANDPADRHVFISPGMAIDPTGQAIILTEPVAYDFGSSVEGELFLMLGHGEREIASTNNEIRYLQSEFVIAARTSIPKRPAVELARVKLSSAGAAIKNAVDTAYPEMDELDLRFRPVINTSLRRSIRIGIYQLGTKPSADVFAGWQLLSREVSRSTRYDLVIDKLAAIPGGVSDYDLLYLAGSGAIKLDAHQVESLKAFIKSGKAVMAEALDEAAVDSLGGLVDKLGPKLKPPTKSDTILNSPYLFTSAPEGNFGSTVTIGNSLVFSSARYAYAWCGKTAKGSREEIRSSHEWGINMLQFLIAGM